MTDAGAESVDCVVIGAGVLGLAIARHLALAGREVIVLEAESAIGIVLADQDHGAMKKRSMQVAAVQQQLAHEEFWLCRHLRLPAPAAAPGRQRARNLAQSAAGLSV